MIFILDGVTLQTSHFSFSKVSETDVKCVLGSLKVNKSCGHDGLPNNKLLRLTSQALAFKTCIEENYWLMDGRRENEFRCTKRKPNGRTE